MDYIIAASEADKEKLNKEKLNDELRDIQIQYELDMQAVANQLTDLNEKYQKDVRRAYRKFNTPIPEKHKVPDMS